MVSQLRGQRLPMGSSAGRLAMQSLRIKPNDSSSKHIPCELHSLQLVKWILWRCYYLCFSFLVNIAHCISPISSNAWQRFQFSLFFPKGLQNYTQLDVDYSTADSQVHADLSMALTLLPVPVLEKSPSIGASISHSCLYVGHEHVLSMLQLMSIKHLACSGLTISSSFKASLLYACNLFVLLRSLQSWEVRKLMTKWCMLVGKPYIIQMLDKYWGVSLLWGRLLGKPIPILADPRPWWQVQMTLQKSSLSPRQDLSTIPGVIVLYRNFEPLLNEDMKDERALVEPPVVDTDLDMIDPDSYMPTVLPLRRPGSLAEPQTSNLRSLDTDLMQENVSVCLLWVHICSQLLDLQNQ